MDGQYFLDCDGLLHNAEDIPYSILSADGFSLEICDENHCVTDTVDLHSFEELLKIIQIGE